MHRVVSAFRVSTTYLTAVFGLLLVIGATGLRGHGAHWVTFGVAIAITAVALLSTVSGYIVKRWVTATLALATVLIGGFLIAATFEFTNASLNWLMAISGATFELSALTSLACPVVRIRVVREPRAEEPREETRYAA